MLTAFLFVFSDRCFCPAGQEPAPSYYEEQCIVIGSYCAKSTYDEWRLPLTSQVGFRHLRAGLFYEACLYSIYKYLERE